MQWKDGNCWDRNYFYNNCFNKPVFLIKIKLIFLKLVQKEYEKHIGVRDVLGIYMKLRYYCGQVRSQLDVLN